MRKLGSFLLVVVLCTVSTPLIGHESARADSGSGTAEDAARAITAARDRANAAADAWAAAESKLELLNDERSSVDAEVAALQRKADALQKTVEAVAVHRYIGTGTTGIALLSGNVGPTEQAQTAVLVDIINEASSSSLDEFADIHKQLDEKKVKADRTARDYAAAQRDYAAKQDAALKEVELLKIVENQRLTSEAVKKALDSQRQKNAEQLALVAADQLKNDQAKAVGAGSDGGDIGQGVKSGNTASGGSAGGTTGSGGSGGRPGAGAGQVYGSGAEWVCPIQGPTGFADTWGEPRSGGRKHEGVDMISPRGTTIVAVVDGVATPQQNELGGTTIWFSGADGNKYYYAHLDSYAKLGNVVKGEVIGYVGDTGNAKFSTPHLHFEIHPLGGPAVDPYPTVAANC